MDKIPCKKYGCLELLKYAIREKSKENPHHLSNSVAGGRITELITELEWYNHYSKDERQAKSRYYIGRILERLDAYFGLDLSREGDLHFCNSFYCV
jgi:hypothetical protein